MGANYRIKLFELILAIGLDAAEKQIGVSKTLLTNWVTHSTEAPNWVVTYLEKRDEPLVDKTQR